MLLFGRKLRILVTAGGTKEPIDAVRFISNFSTGAFGRAFCLEASKRGHEVTLLAPKELPKLAGPLPDDVKHRPFNSTADLKRELEQAAKEQHWDVVIHSAAVSDYTPAEISEGKISSNQKELNIRLIPTPKLIASFREWFGRSFLVGFKLLKGIDPGERHRIALAQIKKNRTNLCVENDLTEVSGSKHKARMVTPEGGALPVPEGSKLEVACKILDFIEKREDVRWFQTVQDPTLPQKPASRLPSRLLKLAQDSRLLTDENGNISMRLRNGQIAMTPRGTDKSQLKAYDMMVIQVDQESRKIYVNNTRKPSIDSSVSDALYKAFPSLNAALHTHSIWGLGAVKTTFPYPCGVKEEAEELIGTLKQSGYQDGNPFLLKLVHHGLMLGLSGSLTVQALEKQWQEVQADFRTHMVEIGISETQMAQGKVQAILAPEGIVGYVFQDQDGTIAPRLLPKHQGKGWGKELIATIREQGLTVKTVDDCRVLDYYKKHGFQVVKKEDRFYYLSPTSKPDPTGSSSSS